jgi:hypothetical protein
LADDDHLWISGQARPRHRRRQLMSLSSYERTQRSSWSPKWRRDRGRTPAPTGTSCGDLRPQVEHFDRLAVVDVVAGEGTARHNGRRLPVPGRDPGTANRAAVVATPRRGAGDPARGGRTHGYPSWTRCSPPSGRHPPIRGGMIRARGRYLEAPAVRYGCWRTPRVCVAVLAHPLRAPSFSLLWTNAIPPAASV